MGHIVHDAVIVTGYNYENLPAPDIHAFRNSLPEEFRPLVIGPIQGVTNGYVTWMFAPDGSKSGWDIDLDGDLYRQRFIDLFAEQIHAWSDQCRFDIVTLTYGADGRAGGAPVLASYATPQVTDDDETTNPELWKD